MYLLDEIEFYLLAYYTAKSEYLYYHFKAIFDEKMAEFKAINCKE